MKILIKDCMLVTMDKSAGIINNGYILIKENKIIEVGSGDCKKNDKDFEVIDGRGYCAMPGLINCHTHAAMTLFRGFGEGLPLMKWLNEKIWPAEAKLNEKHIEAGTRLACIEMLRTGTVAFNDMYFYQDKVMEVAKECNIRAVLGIPIIGDVWKDQLKAAEKLTKDVQRFGGSLVKSMFAPHSPYTLSKEALTEIADTAKEYKSSIHIHISETDDEVNIIRNKYKCTPFEMLLSAGIFENKTVGAHCVHVSDADMDIIEKKGISPVYNPQSNMKLASGVSPVVDMLRKGINVCLGTDGTSSNNNLNMFEEMETGAMLQKLWSKDTTALDAEQALSMATTNGAKALDLDRTGCIVEGNYADIIMLDMNRPNMAPVYDIYSNLVFSANGSEVQYVIINGEIVLRKGEFVKIDEEKAIYEAKEICGEFV